MDRILQLTYESSISKLCEVNSSFDKGVLRICYTGENRNKTYLSKEVLERCIPTMYNCPIVCNYDRDTDTLGGHDFDVVTDEDSNTKIINITTPIGVIPESANVWFEEYEVNGETHEYLNADVLIWKRQEAYKKIKDDGVTAHSMEIKIKDGEAIDGLYYIKDFEFNAFTLVGIEPCFEGSELQMFSLKDFKYKMEYMIKDLKETLEVHDFSNAKNIHDTTEGGKFTLDKTKEQDVAETEDFKCGDAKTKKKSMAKCTVEDSSMDDKQEVFQLISTVRDELVRVMAEYCKTNSACFEFIDFDCEINEVYFRNWEDGIVYGTQFELDGDAAKIDFVNKKRKKFIITDFDDGGNSSPEYILHPTKEDYEALKSVIDELEEELSDLREFKSQVEAENKKAERESIFSKFEDLNGIEDFEKLKLSNEDMTKEELEEKCYAIRGKIAKFSLNDNSTRIKVPNLSTRNEPYGGIVTKYIKFD